MRVTADGERRRDTQVGVFVKAPAVTVFGRAAREGSARTDWWQLPRITLAPLPRAELKGHRLQIQGLQ